MLVQAAAAAAEGQQYPAPALYVVATPIGNLADLTLRALHVLASVDAIACEDTRHSAALLRHFGIAKPLLAVHGHNEREAAAGVIGRLERGERVACVSDAGTPAISDPGAVLVAAVRAAGFRVVPIPGPSSALAALAVAGDASPGGFRFVVADFRRRGRRRHCKMLNIFGRPQDIVERRDAEKRGKEKTVIAECSIRNLPLCFLFLLGDSASRRSNNSFSHPQ